MNTNTIARISTATVNGCWHMRLQKHLCEKPSFTGNKVNTGRFRCGGGQYNEPV